MEALEDLGGIQKSRHMSELERISSNRYSREDGNPTKKMPQCFISSEFLEFSKNWQGLVMAYT